MARVPRGSGIKGLAGDRWHACIQVSSPAHQQQHSHRTTDCNVDRQCRHNTLCNINGLASRYQPSDKLSFDQHRSQQPGLSDLHPASMFSGMSEPQSVSDAAGLGESYPAPSSAQFTVTRHDGRDTTLVWRVVERLAPWQIVTYPGRKFLLLESVTQRVGYAAIQRWWQGKNRFPAWAARQWAAVLTARAEADLALARELSEHAEREEANPRVLRGCCAVRDRGGVVRDGRGGYRAKLPEVQQD